ncbi:hypothetical protein CLOM_g11399 [Closterium sp. NIES-68]|nr:hypothetical protein CLOM_g11399 [Closterium sp. NIES-68]GJP71701.1 hypothetical protein CLOP_g2506 [Closterium sp. NIES-67]
MDRSRVYRLRALVAAIILAQAILVTGIHADESGFTAADSADGAEPYDAEAAYATMAARLREKGLTLFVSNMERSLFNTTLSFLLSRMRLTLLAPINSAFTSLPPVTRRYLTHRASVMHRVLAFHMLGRKISAAQLAGMPAGSLFTTGFEEMELERVEGEGIVLGKPTLGAQGSVRVVLPDLYSDAQMVVHGVDGVMVPDILLDLQ